MDLMNTYKQFPDVMVKGEGNYLIDEQGKRYLDFLSGIAVNPLGYGNKELIEAITHQVNSLIHASNYFFTKPPLELAALLTANTCFDRVFFGNSGAEANEGPSNWPGNTSKGHSAKAGTRSSPSPIPSMDEPWRP